MGSPPFFFMDPGLLQIYALASPGVPLEKLEGEIWDELETLRRDSLSAEILLKAKKQVRSAFLQSLQTHFFKGLLAGIYQVRAGDYRLLYEDPFPLRIRYRGRGAASGAKISVGLKTAPSSPCNR